jgi:hypothetical protein
MCFSLNSFEQCRSYATTGAYCSEYHLRHVSNGDEAKKAMTSKAIAPADGTSLPSQPDGYFGTFRIRQLLTMLHQLKAFVEISGKRGRITSLVHLRIGVVFVVGLRALCMR